MEKSLLEISTERKAFYKLINVDSVTNALDESVSPTSIWKILNQLGRHNFSCGQVVDNLIERKPFS